MKWCGSVLGPTLLRGADQTAESAKMFSKLFLTEYSMSLIGLGQIWLFSAIILLRNQLPRNSGSCNILGVNVLLTADSMVDISCSELSLGTLHVRIDC